MNIVQITPGAGGMFCGGCFRDNALVAELRREGHHALMVPLYLPLTLDEADQTAGTPTFFSGINVYFEQKWSWFRRAPKWVHRIFASPMLLKMAGKHAGKTRAADVGDIAISMIHGEEGNQARELEELAAWLKVHERPDVVCLSNALLCGFARRLKQELNCPVVCVLQGEDTFLDSMPESHRDRAWAALRDRARDCDLFIAPSRYFADRMTERLGLRPERVKVVHNGINLDGYGDVASARKRFHEPPVLGFFARMCRDKGLDDAVSAFIELKSRPANRKLLFHVGGGFGPSDEAFVFQQKSRLAEAGLMDEVRWFPNVDREDKLRFFGGCDIFCTPALYGEAFGLYVIEAMAAGLPVVQPRHGGFPEIVEKANGGVLTPPGNVPALADAIQDLLEHPEWARTLGAAARQSVCDHFHIARMAKETIGCFELAQTLTHGAKAELPPA
jgi:glycosyltransferase involved in cell wall biosynthesis